jgi:hypothetical protein
MTSQDDRPISAFRISEFFDRVSGQNGSPRHFKTAKAWKNPKADLSRQISRAATPAAYRSFIKVIYTIMIIWDKFMNKIAFDLFVSKAGSSYISSASSGA